MSLTIDAPPPPPPPPPYVEAYRSHGGGGSFGPVIAVLALITVLGTAAVLLGRLCFGRSVWGYGGFDLEAWVERKCASCVDGRLAPPPPVTRPRANGPVTAASAGGGGGGGRREAKGAEPPPQRAAEAAQS